MGEAIAAFRDMAVSVRRICDERHSQPRGRPVSDEAAKTFAWRCLELFERHQREGMLYPEKYLTTLCQYRDAAEIEAMPSRGHEHDLPDYIAWMPDAHEPSDAEWRAGFREARREAIRWGALFPVVEARLKDLESAADMLLQYAAGDYDMGATPGQWNESDDIFKREYTKFTEALDALAPFVGNPPGEAKATLEKKGDGNRDSRKPRGRKQSDEALAQFLLAGWKKFRPAEGRPIKRAFVSQLPEVQAMKTDEARR